MAGERTLSSPPLFLRPGSPLFAEGAGQGTQGRGWLGRYRMEKLLVAERYACRYR